LLIINRMIQITVNQKDIAFAKKQISNFEKISQGKWRYSGVYAWRGIVCELLTSQWLEKHFKVKVPAKGLDTSGKVDDYDLLIGDKSIEIKSATKNYFKYIMPKIYDVLQKPKDIYIGVKYNETVNPNVVQIIGYIERENIIKYPIERNKGAKYYKIPLSSLKSLKIK